MPPPHATLCVMFGALLLLSLWCSGLPGRFPPNLMKYQCFHQLPNAKMVKYKNIWAWILKDVEP